MVENIIIDGLNLLGFDDIMIRTKKCYKNEKISFIKCWQRESIKTFKSYIQFLRNRTKAKIHIVIKDYYFDKDIFSDIDDNLKIYIIFNNIINPKEHFQKGVDDAFILYLNKILLNPIILSNDKYKDYQKLNLLKCEVITYPDYNISKYDFTDFKFEKPHPLKFNLEPNY